jgi:thioredoxin-like negative regulator of GroEL
VAVSPLPAAAPVTTATERPRLILFHSPRDGRCRRTEGFLAQVLQRRRNHHTFDIVRVDVDGRPELAERLGIEKVPTLLVLTDKKVRRRIVAPNGCRELETKLGPWLH